ncbi:hypothetical protein, partial [Polycladospora coralii]|uniref:hypothetical protein n=1 Tax=Polycladospora coralii TaxID=2771432 RepID=UPI0034E2BBDB
MLFKAHPKTELSKFIKLPYDQKSVSSCQKTVVESVFLVRSFWGCSHSCSRAVHSKSRKLGSCSSAEMNVNYSPLKVVELLVSSGVAS